MCCITSMALSGQILNADKFGRHTDTSNAFRGNISLALLLNKQEKVLYSTSAAFDLSYLLKENVLILAGSSSFIRSGSENLINGGFLHMRYRHGYNKKYTPELFAQIQYDAIRGLREREIAGANLRRTIFNTAAGYLYLAAGAMVEREEWDYSAVTKPGYQDKEPFTNVFFRINSYLSFHKAISDNAEARLVTYYQVRPDVPGRYRVSGEGQLNLRITKLLSFGLSLRAFYDSKPPVPIENLYYTLNNDLKWRF